MAATSDARLSRAPPAGIREGARVGQYERHVFVCTSGKTCSQQGAELVHATLKDGVKSAGLKGRVRINHAGCMSQCGHGPMVVVYPENVWYAGVDARGARKILIRHLIGGEPVEEYLYRAEAGDNKL